MLRETKDGDGLDDEVASLKARIVELEAENQRLRQVEAAAKEAVAFWEGRRPGFDVTYPRQIISAAMGKEARRRFAPRRTPPRR